MTQNPIPRPFGMELDDACDWIAALTDLVGGFRTTDEADHAAAMARRGLTVRQAADEILHLRPRRPVVRFTSHADRLASFDEYKSEFGRHHDVTGATITCSYTIPADPMHAQCSGELAIAREGGTLYPCHCACHVEPPYDVERTGELEPLDYATETAAARRRWDAFYSNPANGYC